MNIQGLTMWITPLLGAVVLLIFALIIWYPFRKPVLANGLVLIAGALWLLTHALELSTADLTFKIIFLKLKYIGIVMLPIAWYLTAMTYIHVRNKQRIWLRLVIIVTPLITLLLVFTNELHGLFWTQIQFHPDNPYGELVTQKGWFYWIFLIFAYSLVVVSIVPFTRTANRFFRVFRFQTITLIVGVSLPIISTVFDILDFDLIPNMELTPLASGISLLLIFNLNQRLRIGSIVPMLRETIIDHMDDNIFVLDAQNVILDLNTAAAIFLEQPRGKCVGKKITKISPKSQRLIWKEMIQFEPEPRKITINDQNGIQHVYEIVSTPIQLQLSNVRGVIVSLHEITDLLTFEETIRNSLSEKERLLQEIHHRIRNNLQLVSSLLGLQMLDVADPELKNIFNDSYNRIQAMALVHEKLYQAQDLTSIPLGKYVQELANLLVRSQNLHSRNIQLLVNTDPIIVKIDTTISCGLILNELISNALQHAFTDNRPGVIRVKVIEKPGDILCLCVSDNGVGLPEGFDVYATNTLGLQLISTLVRQLQGTLKVEQNCGTEFLIHFPVRSP